MRHKWFQLNSFQFAALCLALVLLCAYALAVSAAEFGGDCGEGLTWSLEGGTLTISGSGDMTDFTEQEMAPWYEYREDILRVSFPEGMTNVGDLAFYECGNLTAVVLPNSVEAVGDYAFARCEDMALLDLGSDLQTIGEAAFSDCYDLRSLDLPDGVESIGMKAFYRCESLTAVTVPDSVESIGMSAFGYCKDMVSANVQAAIDTLPEYMFYGCEKLTAVTLPDQLSDINDYSFRGCDQLSTVYYDGSSKTPEEVKKLVSSDVTGFDGTGVVTNNTPASSVTSGIARDNGDGTVTQENTTVTQSKNASVTATVQNTRPENTTIGGTYAAEVSVTVNGTAGWQEATGMLSDTLSDLNDRLTVDGEAPKVDLNVYVKGTDSIDRDFVSSMAGQNAQATITTRNGSSWKIDCSELDSETETDGYDLRYTVTVAADEMCNELKTETAFSVRFASSATVNAEVLIRLGSAYARQNATLFCKSGRELTRHQTVVVDGQGYAHFYLAAVDVEAEYYIAMNLSAPENDAILPEELLVEYNAIRYEPVQYEITGRKSSWGMNIGQVTWIMVGVLTLCVVGVGFTMYLLNKRKLKSGYVPDISDEDMQTLK